MITDFFPNIHVTETNTLDKMDTRNADKKTCKREVTGKKASKGET